MPDLTTIIEQQAELVSKLQAILNDVPQRPRWLVNQGFLDAMKALTAAIDKYATLLTVECEIERIRPKPLPPPLGL